MSEPTIIFFLLICIVILLITVLYQQFAFRTGIQKKIQKISEKLKEIADEITVSNEEDGIAIALSKYMNI